MESDSSLENEDTQPNRRDWAKVPPAQNNSDVSDDENFSRGAKSIESPPESPWGGANLDSPPASPAPRRSPGSVSGSERARSPERPQTPDSGPESPQNSPSPQNSRNSAPSSPNSQSSKNGSRSRKSRSSSSEGRSRSPSSENERNSPKTATRSPQSDKGPQSPVSDKQKSPDNGPRSPSSSKDGPQSPTSENGHSPPKKSPTRSNYSKQQNESSDSDTSPVRNSFHSDSDEDDRSSEDYRRRRKSNNKRSSSVSSAESGRRKNTSKPQQDKDLDLSDVSDCDSLGPVSDEDNKNINKAKNEKEDGEKADLNMIDDSEQLDFEAEETENNKVENGEIVPQKPPQQKPPPAIENSQEEKDEGELEEGELSDEGEARPEETEPRPVCRFFSRGQCTWGSSCSYRHVGEGGVPPQSQNQKVSTSTAPVAVKPPVQHSPVQHSAPMMQHGPPMMHHGAPMHHPPRFVPRPPFFRRPLRPMFPRFVHPGVTDKGNYTMFEMVRPLVPMNSGAPPMLHGGPHGPPHHPPHHPHMYPPHMDPYMRPPHIERPPPPPMVRTPMPPPYQHQPAVARKEPDSSSESAWERGLRQAKELIRKSSKRKETDADFEEKKMTMSVSGGAEGVDKEGEFYSQAPHSAPGGTTSPYEEDHYSRYNKVDERRLSREGYRERGYEYGAGGGGWGGYDEEGSPPPLHHRAPHRYPPPRHHHPGAREHPRGVDYDYYDEREDRERDRERERRRDGKDRSRKGRSYRDKPSPRDSGGHIDKQPPVPYDLSPSEVAEKRRYERGRGGTKGSKRGADDEWADPWMRSKSPVRKSRPIRKPSYSSKSSFSSTSSSRSSSYTSYSRSESRSSASGSSRSRSRSTSARRNKKRKTSTSRRNKSPFSRGSDKRGSDAERSLHMNPPAPSPTATSIYSRLSPTQRRDRKEMNARLLAAIRKQKRSSSKSSSSGSDSSNSSDESSSSMSDSHSSSSSRSPSPAPVPSASHKSSRKKIVLDEKLAQTMKVKAMDALKLSGQKQQIKLNLKGKDSLSERLQQMPISSSRKRAADSLPFDDDSPPNAKMLKKSGPSRREELLKQLKAVEDAIARKRSKI